MWYFSKAKVHLIPMCCHFKYITFVFVFYSDPFDKICDPFLSAMYFKSTANKLWDLLRKKKTFNIFKLWTAFELVVVKSCYSGCGLKPLKCMGVFQLAAVGCRSISLSISRAKSKPFNVWKKRATQITFPGFGVSFVLSSGQNLSSNSVSAMFILTKGDKGLCSSRSP